mmetsp:Transcript_31445/g.70736  ORF Transcript_31445/g.70736 Transcript_31445/m.70736 type:complete len:393 (-) Transcript_31445:1730-2908(-)
MRKHVLHHDLGKDGIRARVGVAGEKLLLQAWRSVGIFGGEGERGEGVHDKVDPQQLDDRDRALRQRCSSDRREDAGDDVDGELELEELADVVVDAASPLHRRDDGLEVVVEDHNVCRLLRHLRPVDEHGEPDVRLLQRRRVVGPIPRHCDDLPRLLHSVPSIDGDPALLDARHEHELVRRSGAREDAELGPDLVELCLVDAALGMLGILLGQDHLAELLPRQGDLSPLPLPFLGQDVCLPRDRLGGAQIVPGHHAYDDAGLPARLDRSRYFHPQRVLDADNADERQVALDALRQDPITLHETLCAVLVGDGDGAEPRVCKLVDGLVDILCHFRADDDRVSLLVAVHLAELHNHLRRSLAVEAEGSRRARGHGHKRAHPLPLGGEGDTRSTGH